MQIFKISTLLILFTFTASALAKEKGAPPMVTGAPGNNTCGKSRCHTSFEVNSGPAVIEVLGFPKVYTPGETYELTIVGKQADIKTWGFEITLADTNNKPAGDIQVIDTKQTQRHDPRRYAGRSELLYITHTKAGIHTATPGESPHWSVRWIAPETPDSPAQLYVAINAANGDEKKYGDYTYTRQFVSVPAEADSTEP